MDLDLGSGPILPRAGDQVRETVGTSVFVYEVNRPRRATPVSVQRPVPQGTSDSHQTHRHGDVMSDPHNGNGQNGTKARWAGVLVTIILAAVR